MKNKSKLEELVERLRKAESELAEELERVVDEKRKQFHYTLRRGRIVFEKNVRRLQRKQRLNSWRYLRAAPLSYILSAPIIYGMIIPLIFLDISITVYQHVCFRIYRIPRVRRAEYIAIDRHHLSYLNIIEKINCVYCGYGNGLMSYAREITARTEQFWCPIKHARKVRDSHKLTSKFFEYGDANAWREKLKDVRESWYENPTSPIQIVDSESRNRSKGDNNTQ